MQNLLDNSFDDAVIKTNLTKKLTIDGITKAYPVYRVRLDLLFYNDQNDRIATWISQYKSENGVNSFQSLSHYDYNSIIEKFIIESNETSIQKTQNNIELVNQREAGVVLSDGRVIDGNRRFTCLRRLAQNDEKFNWFETVILDTNIESSKKQIKMLELSIQHGEEKKVDYNTIDRLVGVYQDIVENKLLTIEEYALSTNETEFEVKKKIELALILVEFLEFIHMPKQYHIARDYQVVSVITDLRPLLNKCSTVEMKQKLKNAVFTNIMMGTIGDSRKYIRNLSSMMDSGFFTVYIKEQDKIKTELDEELDDFNPKTKADLESFANEHEELAENLHLTMDKSLLKAKKHETRSQPSKIVSKSITLLKDVDTRIFEKLNDSEKENLKQQLNKLSNVVDNFDTLVDDKPNSPVTVVNKIEKEKQDKRYFIAKKHINEPYIDCMSAGKVLTALSVTLDFKPIGLSRSSECQYRVFFLDEQNELLSNTYDLTISDESDAKCTITLNTRASSLKECYLALQSKKDKDDELQQLIPFEINISFVSDFDF